ncbi:GNAT family N-acetyltransferase [Phycicoccus sp. 3266]|uniref:GNAT family N-acetyltransferase n=1 Tax=Phycicoccus sp. 3266 TaxID=2817751 RepID=UPI00285CEECD|nr:GNAT family N-acetyltransferase [Phycicoccus sp. 3266]MDR6862551.1 GNAT superfamily N-acetyltransferase [Phycicoccus sp. 3266]
MDGIVAIDPDGPDEVFLAWCDVLHASAVHDLGDLHSARTPEERRVLLGDPARRTIALGACDERGSLVGAATLAMPLHDNLRLSMLDLAVHPDQRGRGHGRRLLQHAEGLVREAGRDLVVADTQWRAGADDVHGGFAGRFGYQAAQTNLRSSLALPLDRDRPTGLLADHDGDGYVLRTALGGIPDAWVGARALLARRMSTDVPLGDLQIEEEVWDEERVRADYERIVHAGRTAVDTFAFTADGSVAGYTQTTVTSDPSVVYQQDTLVLREHRGHRLGLRMKAANTLALMDHLPGPATVRTWNAEENAPMLAVNRELGYAEDAAMREWQKELR